MKRLLQWGCWAWLSLSGAWPTVSMALDDGVGDCRLRQLASIELKIGIPVLAPVSLDGVPGFMALSNGLPLSTIFQPAVTEMKLVIDKSHQPVSNSPGLVSIGSLSLGSYDIGKVRLLVTDAPKSGSPQTSPYIGSFALPTLFGMDYEIDYAHNKLNLFSANHCSGNVVYWADKAAAIPYSLDKVGIPVFPIELDGKKLSSTLALGAPRSLLRTDFSKALYGFDERSSGIRTEAADSGNTAHHYRAMKMSLPGLSVTNADLELIAGAKGCTPSPNAGPEHSAAYQNCFGSQPLVLGLDVLQHLRLYFATKERVLYVTPADATREAAPATR
jgi:hypothetical protein